MKEQILIVKIKTKEENDAHTHLEMLIEGSVKGGYIDSYEIKDLEPIEEQLNKEVKEVEGFIMERGDGDTEAGREKQENFMGDDWENHGHDCGVIAGINNTLKLIKE